VEVGVWLSGVAARLGAADPVLDLGPLIARTFDRPPGHPGYVANTLAPGFVPLELSFSEREPETLRLDVEPFGGDLTAAARRAETIATVTCLAGQFGADTGERLSAAIEEWSAGEVNHFGAFFGAAFDASGLVETTIYLDLPRSDSWSPPDPSAHLLEIARASLPGVVPLMHAISAGKGGLSERFSLVCLDGLRLLDLASLLETLSLSDRLPALLDSALALSGGRFTLPPGTAVFGLRETPGGFELKLELLVACLPVYALAVVERLLTARPASAAAFARWQNGLVDSGPGALAGPGIANVVSVRVGPDTGPEINLYLRPAALRRICQMGDRQ